MKTKRLSIRKFTEEDWQDLFDYLSKEEVVEFEPYDVLSVEECKKEAIRRSQDDSFWAVCIAETNKLIGNIYLASQEFDTQELGYVFNPEFQGKGYATEAALALIEHAFKEKHAHRIFARCNPLNVSSWQLLERLGLRREGHLRQNIWFKKDGQGKPIWVDTFEYAILASEY